ncbi:hypothetical protein X801_06967, partial [Opisthorchis viverrini]
YFLGPKDIFPYEKYKAKYAVSRNKPLFQAGLREIEENPDVLLYGKDPDAEAFLARFYKFDFTGIQAPPQVSTGKRSGGTQVADKEYEKPAKRPHVETPTQPAPPSKKKTTSSDVSKTAKPRKVQDKSLPTTKSTSNRPTPQRRVSRPQLPGARLLGSAPAVTTDSQSATPLRPQRVSSLRLRIRKGADGLQFSPAHDPSLSSLSPPTSTSTASTTGAEQVVDESSKLTQEPLRITIKAIPATSATDDKAESPTPVSTVFSISNPPLGTTVDGGTPTPSGTTSSSISTASSTVLATTTLTTTASTLMGVGNNSAIMARKKSTAVVTPLRRDKVLPQLSDESADLSSVSEDEVAVGRNDRKRINARNVPTRRDKHKAVDIDRSPLRFLHTDTSVSHSRLKRKKKNENSLTKEAANANISSFGGSGSETGSCSATTSPWASNDWSKSGSSQTGTEQQSPKDAQKNVTYPPPSRSAMGAPSPLPPRKQQEQQLKDLDTEARLLLIDRSIKSSLVRDHEDISTCVDRLEMLDRIQISLPVLAKCWIVVETIRKCRRYKRSMEVKIAAQKVFNKFLQLYATADKCELDLANAELAKHQQRHIKQHLVTKGDLSTSENSVVPPYMGPKTMSELFQLSAAALAERRRIGQSAESASTRGVISPATSSVDSSDIVSTLTSSEAMKRLNLHVDLDSAGATSRANKFSLGDIPLPSETNSALLKPTAISNEVRPSAPTTVGSVNPEEEYEVLDEYEAASDQKFGITANRHAEPAHSSSAPAASSSIEYIPTTMVETQIIPYHLVPPHMLPGPNGSLPPAYCPENYACSASVAPYSVAYSPMSGAVPYSFACLPSVPYPQVLHPSQLGPPYNPAINAAVHPVSIEVTPPQTAARAYVPHPLQPCADPPPYRPYLPEPEVERPADSPKRTEYHPSHGRQHQESDKRSGSFLHPRFKVKSRSPLRSLSSSSSSHGRRESSDRHSRHHRSLRTPPRRARSPHELPHPLEHYQRYLKSALTSDEDTDERAPTSHRHQKTSEDRYSTSITSRLFEDGRLIRSRTDSDVGGKTQSSKNITEDLDTRIARIIGTATTTNKTQTNSDVKDVTKTSDIQKPLLVSPPPPPPPPTASQRVLFTHRPHQGISSEARNIVKHVPCAPVLHSRGPAPMSKQHPPPTPDSPPPRRCLPSAQPPIDAVHSIESRLSSKAATPSTTSSTQPTVSSNPLTTSTTSTSRPPSVGVVPSEDEHSGAPRTREDDRDLYTL